MASVGRQTPIGTDITEDAVLGGRLRLRQPKRGHRVGHDAILLAAACPARAGDKVVDLGAGVGAAGLALAARVAGHDGDAGRDRSEARGAGRRERRGSTAWRRACARSRSTSRRRRAPSPPPAWPPKASRAVLMNPPFNDPARQRASPDAARALAHAAPRSLLVPWVKTAARLLRPRGTLTLIWRADGLADVLAALAPAFGALAVTPVHPARTSRRSGFS